MAKEEVLSYIDYIKSKSRRKSEKAELDLLYIPTIDNVDELDIPHIDDDPTHHDDHIHQSEGLKEDSESKVVIDFQDLEQSQPKSTAVTPKISSKEKVSAEYNIYFSMLFGAAK